MSSEVIVLGCGIIGLSSALRLQARGYAPRIITRDLPQATTSQVAAAIWYIYNAYPLDKAQVWARATLAQLHHLADHQPGCGVSLVPLMELTLEAVADPWWRDDVRNFRRLTADEIAPPFADGFGADIPLIEPGLYLPYLLERFRADGGVVEQRTVASLDELVAPNRVIIHCTGVYARDVAGDAGVYPLRGQVVRVAKRDAVSSAFMDESDHQRPRYIIPRSGDIVVGGTLQKDVWDLTPDPAITAEIIARGAAIYPDLADAPVLSVAAGLRPGRDAVRLELEWCDESCAVIHNYGHGGAGFTLAWGCADEVVALADVAARRLG